MGYIVKYMCVVTNLGFYTCSQVFLKHWTSLSPISCFPGQYFFVNPPPLGRYDVELSVHFTLCILYFLVARSTYCISPEHTLVKYSQSLFNLEHSVCTGFSHCKEADGTFTPLQNGQIQLSLMMFTFQHQ